MKRILAILMSVAMLLSVCAVASAETEQEPLEISLGIWDINEWGDDNASKLIKEKFNMTFDIYNEDWGNYDEQLFQWAASDELPEVFCGYIDETYTPEFIDQQYLRDIPLEMLQKYPSLYATWQADTASQALYNYYGKIYYVPRTDALTPNFFIGSYTGGAAIYYRKDWAEKLGFEKPTNCDELLDMLIAFAQQDPDGDGQADTYGLSTTFGRLESIWGWFNCYPTYWIKTADGYEPGYLDKENMMNGLTWLRKAYENGAIDPELQGNNTGFADGTFGAYSYHSNPGWGNNVVMSTFGGANPDIANPYDIIDSIVAIPQHEGEEATARPYFSDTGTFFTSNCSDDKVDRILQMIEWLYSDEGILVKRCGFEGDYTWNEETQHYDRAETPSNNPCGCVFGMISWDAEAEYESKFANYTPFPAEGRTQQDQIDWGNQMREQINAAAQNPAITFDLTSSLITTDEKATYMFDYKTALMEIVTGTDDVEAMYDQFVTDAMDYGLQDVIDSVNTALAK